MLKRVLFLCTGNYYRSRFAEEVFNHCAAKDGVTWQASSRALAIERGSQNVGPMSQFALEALYSRSIRPAGASRLPAACSLEALATADLVVALKEAEHRPLIAERFNGWQDRVEYWHVHDIDVAPPAEAIKMIEGLVHNLVRTL